MKKRVRSIFALLTILGTTAGTVIAAEHEDETSAYLQGFSLVFWQVDKLKNIDKILLVKLERDVVEDVTTRVATLSAEIAGQLELLAEDDIHIQLDREYLPPVEAGARDKMGTNIARELLFTGGCDFEQRLIFTQAVAVLRISALAEEMSERAPNDEHAEFWTDVHERSATLFEDIRDLINSCPHD